MSRRIERMSPPTTKRVRERVHSISVSRRAGWKLEDAAAKTGRSMSAIVEEIILAKIADFEARAAALPKYRFCWRCSRQLWGDGVVVDEPNVGLVRVHGRCDALADAIADGAL